MGSLLLTVLDFIAEAQGAWWVLRLTGLPRLARWLLRSWVRRVTGRGFRFYFQRSTLEREQERLGQRFAGAEHVDVLWVKGGKFYDENENLHTIKRVILPDPQSASVKLFKDSIEQDAIGDVIRDVTRKALKHGAKVRWSREFFGVSMNIVDSGRENGWVHIEVVLPYSMPRERPSFTIYKSRSPNSVLEFQRIFNEIWEDSKEQTMKE